jgi:hypothetical protein
MALVHELDIEIATAILTAKAQSPAQLNELKEIVLKVHAALQEMAEKERCQLHQPCSQIRGNDI